MNGEAVRVKHPARAVAKNFGEVSPSATGKVATPVRGATGLTHP